MSPLLATFVKSCVDVKDLPPGNRPQVALIGRSNVGKSSFVNALTQKKDLSRVSASPGRTRFLNVFDINHAFLLVDLPGYGYAKASKKERERHEQLIYDYLTKTTSLRLVLLIIDSKVGPTDLDIEMIGFLEGSKIPFILVANKIDKLSRTEMNALFQHLSSTLPHGNILPHSSTTRVGQGEIWQAIERAIKV